MVCVSPAASAHSEAAQMPAAGSSHAQRVLSSLNQQRAVGRFCDAVLNVGGGVVYLAHRNILACFSDLFQRSNTSSSSSSSCMELSLQQCPNDGLELLLNFVYTGELKLDLDNLDKVQHAATSLCVPEALALCQQFKETSAEPVPLKRKRGRPRKSSAAADSVKQETSASRDPESSTDADTTSSSSTTTTTRSGRVVKGPRRLVTDEGLTSDLTATDSANKRAAEHPVEKLTPEQTSGETEVNHSSVFM